ncbi:carbon starvation protein A [bacterium]|nr:carbon starvation protein A [bacterium]
MNSLILAVVVFVGYIIAYNTYGKFLSRRIFRINPDARCPSSELQDNIDFVPTDKHVLFGHHFTSIAGLGPIVGPSIAIIWGWIPAVLWVLFGAIFMGAVHDFGSVVISMRHQGRSIGDVAADIINSRVRTLFLIIVFFGLLIVIAVFGLIIAILFNMYPQAVIPVWLEVPIALLLGYLVYNKKQNHVVLGIVAVILMYITVIIGTYVPLQMPTLFGLSPLAVWIIILLIYAFIASTLPVQILLQPRDYINSHQLIVAMVLLSLGVLLAHPTLVAPAVNLSPADAPPLFPLIFVVIACGAISGFHSLVASGTTSKQCDNEKSAKFIGYGGMLTEGALATLVIIAVAAGLGMKLTLPDGQVLTGAAAFNHHYSDWAAASGLAAKIAAFVTGSANIIESLSIPVKITVTIMGVFLVSFAATTMDTAVRIQRYVISELATAWSIKPLTNRYNSTFVAILSAFLLAFYNGSGNGALTLWPLFGSVNQLLAGLALLVITIYLAKQKIRVRYTAIPMVIMVFLTGWAMILNLKDFYLSSNWLLFTIGLAVFALEIWMIIESVLVLKRVKSSN